MSKSFGLLTFGANKNILKQLEEVQERLQRSQTLSQDYNMKYKELSRFNMMISEGYVNNLNVIVDLSRVLSEYKDTMDEVIKTMKKFDEMLFKDLENVNVEHLKDLTLQSLQNIDVFFKSDVDKIRGLFSSLGKSDFVNKINKSQQIFQTTVGAAIPLYEELKKPAQGGAKIKVSPKKVRVYPTKKQLDVLRKKRKNVA